MSDSSVSVRVTVPFSSESPLQVVEVERIPLILVRRDGVVSAFLDNCPDEDKPLEPVLNRHGDIVCTQHGARFDCAGCLVDPGNAHHPKRCEEGLLAVPANAEMDDRVELVVTPELRREADEVRRRRARRAGRRSPRGLRGLLYRVKRILLGG